MKRAYTAFALLAVFARAAPDRQRAQPRHHRPQHGGARFPDRAYVLTLAGRALLRAGSVKVRENGKLVKA